MIYLVVAKPDSDTTDILAAFSTRDGAEAYIESISGFVYDSMEIEEFEVDRYEETR